MSGLTQKGAEFQGFAHGSRMQMKVLLLNISSFALKGRVTLLTVDKHAASDDTNRRAFGKDVQKGGFTSTRHTLRKVSRQSENIRVVNLPSGQ